MTCNDILGNRKTIRLKTDINIIFLDSNDTGRVISLSCDGCKIAVLKELVTNNQYNVVIKLPERDVIVETVCLRTDSKETNYECVLLFNNPSPSVISYIDKYMCSILENLEDAISRKVI